MSSTITTTTHIKPSELLPLSLKYGNAERSVPSVASPEAAAAVAAALPKSGKNRSSFLNPPKLAAVKTSYPISYKGSSCFTEAPPQQKPLVSLSLIVCVLITFTIASGVFSVFKEAILRGPVISLTSYCYAGYFVWSSLQSISESKFFMEKTAYIGKFQFRVVSYSASFTINLVYWLSWSITLAIELLLIHSTLSYYNIPLINDNKLLVILAAWAMLTFNNIYQIKQYKHAQTIYGLLKFATISGLLIFALDMNYLSGAFKRHESGFAQSSFEFSEFSLHGSSVSATVLSVIASCLTFHAINKISKYEEEIKLVNKRSCPTSKKSVLFKSIILYVVTLVVLSSFATEAGRISETVLSTLATFGTIVNSSLMGLSKLFILWSLISAANANIRFGSSSFTAMVKLNRLPKSLNISTLALPTASILCTSTFGLLLVSLTYQPIETYLAILVKITTVTGLLVWVVTFSSYVKLSRFLHFQSFTQEIFEIGSRFPKELQALNYFTIIQIVLIFVFQNSINVSFLQVPLDSSSFSYCTMIFLVMSLKVHWSESMLVPTGYSDVFTGQSPLAYLGLEEMS